MIMIQHFSHFYMIICGKPRQLIQRNIFDRILLITGIALSVHLHDVSTFLLHQVVLQAVPPELFTNGSELVRFRMSEKKISVMSRIDAASICAEQLIGDLSGFFLKTVKQEDIVGNAPFWLITFICQFGGCVYFYAV